MSNYDDICYKLDKAVELILEAIHHLDEEGLSDTADELVQINIKVHSFFETFRDNY